MVCTGIWATGCRRASLWSLQLHRSGGAWPAASWQTCQDQHHAPYLPACLQELLLGDGRRLPYDKLCICAGARPKQLPPTAFHARPAPGLSEAEAEAERQRQEAELRRRVLTIRDTDSVQRLAARLRGARRVAVVGNGGIALELM